MKKAGLLFLFLALCAVVFNWNRAESERDMDDRAREAGL